MNIGLYVEPLEPLGHCLSHFKGPGTSLLEIGGTGLEFGRLFPAQGFPRGSKYPIFLVSGSKDTLNGFVDQRP